MKIFLDNIIFSLQQAGGISVVWYEILSRLLKETDVDLTCIEYDNDNILRRNLDIHHSSIVQPKTILPFSINRYCNVRGLKGVGLFHSSYYRIVNSKRVKNITTVHDFTYEYYRKGLAKKIHYLQKKHAINNSVGIICVSENTKKDVLHFNPKIDESKLKVIHNGVSLDYHPLGVEKRKLLKKLVRFEPESYILYVGDRKSKYKNFELAVRSCKETKIPLVLVGGGVLIEDEIVFLKKSLGEHNYTHKGNITNTQLNILYNNAFCLLYPSFYEGFGIPIIEAQRAGCPVICNNSSSIPEIAGNGGYVIDNISVDLIKESVLFLKNRHGERKLIIEKGILNSHRFSWDNTYENTLNFYKEIYQNHF